MRLIARLVFVALVHGGAYVWVALNGGLFMSDPEARLFKVAITLLAAMLGGAFLLDWLL